MITLIELVFFFFFKQKTAYEMRISDWSSDVCSSDLGIDLIEQIVDDATVAVCAEATGVMQKLHEGTLDYTRQRKQFGIPIAKDRKSVVEGKSVSVRVDLGGRRTIKKKTKNHDK